jgi:hypothetical protein
MAISAEDCRNERRIKVAVMSYVVKWRLSGKSQTFESPASYPVPSNAIDFACTVFKQHPLDIWVEGPGGIRIERKVIFRQCQDRRPSG